MKAIEMSFQIPIADDVEFNDEESRQLVNKITTQAIEIVAQMIHDKTCEDCKAEREELSKQGSFNFNPDRKYDA